MSRRPSARASALAGLALLAAACGSEPDDPRADLVARSLAAAHYSESHLQGSLRPLEKARAALAPLVARRRPQALDVVHAAIVELELGEHEAARALLQRAAGIDPELADVPYNQGRMAWIDGRVEEALGHYARAHALAPDDYPTHLALANTLYELDRMEEAEPHYRALLAVGLDYSGSWYLTTLYRLGRLKMLAGDDEEGGRLLAEYEQLRGRGIAVPVQADLERGNFGQLRPPPAAGTSVVAPERMPAFPGAPLFIELAGVDELAALTLVQNWFDVPERADDPPADVGASDLVAFGPAGLFFLERDADGRFAPRRVFGEPVEHVAALDLDARGDADLDFFVVSGTRLLLLVNREGELELSPLSPGERPGTPSDLELVDYDHEGDLDLLVVGPFGTRLFRNDGASQSGTGAFVDATREAGLDPARVFEWCLAEDLDTDQDVDLLLGGATDVLLADSLRGGRFADASERLGAWRGARSEPLVADLDGDGRPDLWVPGDPPRVLRSLASGRWNDAVANATAPAVERVEHAVDIDLDGALDVLALARGGDAGLARVRLALGLAQERAGLVEGTGSPGAVALVAADLDGDLDVDLARIVPGGIEVHLAAGGEPGHGAVRLALIGVKDNRRGIGAIVEVLAGPIYRRIFWRGEPVDVGLGAERQADVVRVVWPNGIVQYAPELVAGSRHALRQKEGLSGSCPFLYTWNGSEFEYISDVLGITPLGLPMAPGVLVPPDHDEYVLVRGDQMTAREGFFELHVTEELREVTYLDRVRLDVVDHPAGTEIWPDERFTFPPFPAPHTHTTRDLLVPADALGSDGRHWTDELAAIDGRFAVPFEPLEGQLQGLATPHYLELAFDAERVAQAERLRLLCTGWLYWTDASVNVAAARTPGVEFVPPVVQVPDGAGGWRDAGPPVGFPAGKTKTMVIDVAGLLDARDPRLRLASTLRLYWDAIRLATDGDDAPLEVTSLEPASAELWRRGYSEPYLLHPEHGLEWFTWELVACRPRWNPHPGLYTRFGDVLELLGAVDDRFAIFGAGDALTLRFDAAQAPPLRAGFVRDYLVFFDGWAKDRDPNTLEALYVEPLPFHGMSAYPYGPDERFPDDAEHRAWRNEWNTREAQAWIEPLAPRARFAAPMAR